MEKLAQMSLAQFKQKYVSGKVVLFFTADWCPDCRFIKPAMPQLEQEFGQMQFLVVDRDENLELARELNVFGIPSFVVFANGKKVADFINKERKTKEQVATFLASIK